jgi:protein tyrosine/serine phosphatase
MTPNWIDLEGAHNVRDLGGLPTTGGAVTRPGVLLRSDALDALTDADVQRLVDGVGLAHVVDLRSNRERVERGRGALGTSGVTYSELEVIDDKDVDRRRDTRASAFSAGTDPDTIIATGYAELLDLGRSAFVEAVNAVAAPGGTPALVHCTAGKDRTGVLVALLLDVAGVEREAIVADYAATHERMPAIVERIRSASAYQEVAEEVPAFVFGATEATMRHFLTHLDETWGGGEAYFEANGAAPSTLATWRARFVEA